MQRCVIQESLFFFFLQFCKSYTWKLFIEKQFKYEALVNYLDLINN